MEQTPVATAHIDDDFLDQIAGHLDADSRVKAAELLSEYKERFTQEVWEGWTLAQGLAYNEERDAIEDERRILDESRRSLHRNARKYNTHIFKHHAEFPDEEEKFEAHPACTGDGCETCKAEAAETPEAQGEVSGS